MTHETEPVLSQNDNVIYTWQTFNDNCVQLVNIVNENYKLKHVDLSFLFFELKYPDELNFVSNYLCCAILTLTNLGHAHTRDDIDWISKTFNTWSRFYTLQTNI